MYQTVATWTAGGFFSIVVEYTSIASMEDTMDIGKEGNIRRVTLCWFQSRRICCVPWTKSYHDVSMESRATETGKRILQWKESKVVMD